MVVLRSRLAATGCAPMRCGPHIRGRQPECQLPRQKHPRGFAGARLIAPDPVCQQDPRTFPGEGAADNSRPDIDRMLLNAWRRSNLSPGHA